MPIRTRRWNDPQESDDGFRLLVCRLRPLGLTRAGETWDEWWPDLGPSRGLLGAFQGKAGQPLPWSAYVPRYLAEMEGPAQVWRLRELGRRVADGETVTLLCSAACTDPTRCHRTVLATLIERSFGRPRPRP